MFSASAINAALALDKTLLAKEGLIVVLGYSEPMLLELQKREVGHHIAVYDPDFIGPPLEGIHRLDGKDFSFFEAWHPQILNGQMLLISHNPTVTANPEPYETFKLKLAEQKRLMESNIGTQLGLGRYFMDNFIENIPVILKYPGVNVLKGLFPNVPAILLSAGPSLEQHANLLKDNPGCILIAVDATLPFLISHGIRPHFVVAVDPMDENKRFFTDYEFLSKTAFICLAQYTPEVVRNYKGPMFFSCSPGSAIYQWLGRFMGEDRGYLPCDGGSVSHMALSLAEHLGCNPVAFVGLDLSWKDKFYVWNTAEILGGDNRELRPKGDPAINVHGDPCYTQNSFDLYRICFEQKLERSPHITAFNCSDGLPIKGATQISLVGFLLEITEWPDTQDCRYEISESIREGRKDGNQQLLMQEVVTVCNLFSEILQRAERASVLVDLIESAYKKKQTRKMQARIQQLQMLADKIRTPYLNLVAYYCYGLELFMQRAEIRDVGKIEDASERLEAEIRYGREYYKHLTDGIRGFLKPLRSLKEQLREGR